MWWTSGNRGNLWILQNYLPNLTPQLGINVPDCEVMEPDIVSFWNFLNIFEDPELQKHRVPTHGLVLTKLRHQKSDEYWEYLIWKTSQFIRRINKRK